LSVVRKGDPRATGNGQRNGTPSSLVLTTLVVK
jgi:hypothetical protein